MLSENEARMRQPEMVEMAPRKLAVVYTHGDPNTVQQRAIQALYGAVYELKFELKRDGRRLKVEPLRARWPDAHTRPKEEWLGLWALPIPEDTTNLAQKVPGIHVYIETWDYGTVAQVLHAGPYSDEAVTVQALEQFIADSGYEIAGIHEEEYLTTPAAKVQKTIIRYPVRKVPQQHEPEPNGQEGTLTLVR